MEVGSVVGSDYDSLLAKVVAHGPERASVAASLARSLRTADLAGVRTNADTLAAICAEDDFIDGRATTAYLDEHPDVSSAGGPADDERLAQCLAALLAMQDARRRADSVTGFAPSGWRNVRTQGQRTTLVDMGAVEGAADASVGARVPLHAPGDSRPRGYAPLRGPRRHGAATGCRRCPWRGHAPGRRGGRGPQVGLHLVDRARRSRPHHGGGLRGQRGRPDGAGAGISGPNRMEGRPALCRPRRGRCRHRPGVTPARVGRLGPRGAG
ncbi:MAG: hypothetical protein M5U19_06485 [Microthrixaceae bacterium]|nr:hypothetical protein [Microthrixaceae bacterium]